MELKNCVYKFINNNDEINYIGKAINLNSRIVSHNHLPEECYNSTFVIEYSEFETKTKDDIDILEKYFIAKYNPKYNEIYKNKDLTIGIEETKNIDWKLYDKNNFAIRNYLKFINDIEFKLNNIQIDIDIMDYYLMFTMIQNFTYQFYERYKSYEKLNNTEKLDLYTTEFDELKNKDTFEKIFLLQNKVSKEIKEKVDSIFAKNKLLEYSIHLPQQHIKTQYGKLDRVMNLIQLNECINLSDNTFKLYIDYKCKYYDTSKQLTVWVKCRD
ncbi:MAG: GIY-YIG nuclease family protein [Romboutsia timonensis]|uniref:GIY-YIG nuclease family protein n=1 Tax=Romboutsia timonensis TaxID=1776391 RepID=UPI002A750AEF|nr:GIY-YIG nuclease family protein [Romboutsia timonensis]MDY2883457.1 GIY-YIG nuclease family protein [Romboutsia timonensis]